MGSAQKDRLQNYYSSHSGLSRIRYSLDSGCARASLTRMTIFILNSKGFTILEVLVTVVVLSVLTTFTFASFSNISRVQYLKEEALNIKSDFRYVQNQAVNGVRPSECLGDLAGYSVVVDSAAAKYTTAVDCLDNPDLLNPKDYTLMTKVSIDQTNKISVIDNNGQTTNGKVSLELFFLPNGSTEFYENGVKLPNIQKAYFNIFYESNSSLSYRINIESSGGIYEQKN